ncbi:hypothetical protein GGR50DRAFT_656371 [Xylaria sp. CBS 124048]|nr:hypothetical protein GGR50DRAFT_656371 [Xylaria sp. CBS 124048]
MATLTVPDTGLQLESPPGSRDFLPMQAFGITLDDGMIEDMIRCVQSGQEVELTLGNNPLFHYGSNEEKVSADVDSINYDLYLTDPTNPGSKTQRLPHPTMSIFKKPPTSLTTKKSTKVTSKLTGRASFSGADSDADARIDSHIRGSDKGSKLANGGPKSKLLSAGKSAMASVLSSTTNRSLPSSPALNGVSSPNPAFSASQQILEKNKGQRSVLVHELAVRDQTFQHLQDVWTCAESELKPTVVKVADFNNSTEKWSLKKIFWKELDVWNYEYRNAEDRQSAIDNAIKSYDRQRVVLSDPVWERLLPKEDRNKGIVLSKLQATIAKQNTIAPTPKIQKTENGNKSDIDSSKNKGEASSKSNARSAGNKTKKISEREAQTKRLLSTKPKKPAPKKPAPKVKVAEAKDKRVLSEEFVYDTETSEEDAPQSQTTKTAPKSKASAKAKATAKAASKTNEKQKEPAVPQPTLKPKPKPIVRAPRAPAKAPATAAKSLPKQSAEDEDSSSSSGAPLSKRNKPKQPPAKPKPKPAAEPKAIKHRASDASQNSRGTNSTVSSSLTMKSKNTSPIKSSPLATSPPTNASDFDERNSTQRPASRSQQLSAQQRQKGEQDREGERRRGQAHVSNNGGAVSNSATTSGSSASVASKKRKERESVDESTDTTPTPPSKKARLSKDIMVQATKFARFYKSYETLHYEIAALKEPPEEKLADLLDMRERLVIMKRDIQRAVAAGA